MAGPLKPNNNMFSARKKLTPNIENFFFQIAPLKLYKIMRHKCQIIIQEIRNRTAISFSENETYRSAFRVCVYLFKNQMKAKADT